MKAHSPAIRWGFFFVHEKPPGSARCTRAPLEVVHFINCIYKVDHLVIYPAAPGGPWPVAPDSDAVSTTRKKVIYFSKGCLHKVAHAPILIV